VSARIVWLASYPKSGNTWLRAVVAAWRGAAPVHLKRLIGRSAASREHFDEALGVASSDLTSEEIDGLRPLVYELWADERDEPLLLKTHDGLYPGPHGDPLVPARVTQTVIYMVRDPRDVAVSLAHHLGREVGWAVDRLADPDMTLSPTRERIRHLLPQWIGHWSDHVLSWIDGADCPVHVLRYEDCLTDPLAAFKPALSFAELGPVDDDDLALAIDRARFDRLRDQEAETGFPERSIVADRFFRRGIAGSWRDEMTAADARRVERSHAEVMKRLGYL
jgi:aryl sulfotransferase